MPRLSAEAAVGATGLVVFGWGMTRPSPWRDELVTIAVASRPVGAILDVVRHTDLVHAVYYLLIHAFLVAARPVGADPMAVARAVSVLAMAGAGVALVRVGRSCGHPGVGVLAGLLLATSPMASRYAQEARPYALAALATTCACAQLLRASQRPGGRGRWLGYAGIMTVAVAINLMSGLLLAAHGLYLVTRDRTAARAWAASAAGSVAVLSPFLVATFAQREQVAWMHTPSASDLVGFFAAQFAGLRLPIAVALVAAVLGVLAGRPGVPPGVRRDGAGDLLVLGLLWAVLPPVLLWGVARVHPFWDSRYVVFALPGTALALASTLTRATAVAEAVGRRRSARTRRVTVALPALLAAALMIAAACTGLAQQIAYRRPADGHGEDWRQAAADLGRLGRAGDGLAYVPWQLRVVGEVYPGDVARLSDVALLTGPTAGGTVSGADAGGPQVLTALARLRRVWVLGGPTGLAGADDGADLAEARLLQAQFRPVLDLTYPGVTLTLFERLRA